MKLSEDRLSEATEILDRYFEDPQNKLPKEVYTALKEIILHGWYCRELEE
jgi:hypothetical protein